MQSVSRVVGKARRVVSLRRDSPSRGRGRLGWSRARGLDPEAVSFQPDALLIEARPYSWYARSTLYIVIACVLSAVVWASLAQIDRIVTASGKVVTRDPVMVV